MIKICTPQGDGNYIKTTKFPNGESKVEFVLPRIDRGLIIEWKFESDDEIFHLMSLVNDIRDMFPTLPLELWMPYLPYSRMDRKEIKGICFTLKTFCKIINSLDFWKVTVYEPHSDVGVAMLDRVNTVSVTGRLIDIAQNRIDVFLKSLEDAYMETVIVFPDTGASKRYNQMFTEYRQLVGIKKRDFISGKITDMEIIGDIPDTVFNAIIIDDLCSYGGTFALAGKALKELGANNIILCVTHCEDSIHKGVLLQEDVIKLVVTTDSILTNFSSEKIIVEKL